MTAPVAAWTARLGLALWVVHGAAAQSAPQGLLYKHLQAFEAEAKFTPQTRKERLHAYLLSVAGPASLVAESGAAGLSQALDSPWQWGQGIGGYGRRFANDLAYNGVRCTLTYGSSTLLHEDDRYFASEQRGGWPRVRHALASVFTAHKSDGRAVFATSSAVGIVGASLISRAWSPQSWQTPGGVAHSVGISVAGAAGEFLPEILHRTHN
jgi:hypothetical protein